MPEKVLLLPSANRIMVSMSNIGYDLPTSVADLVDNSVTAGATEVHIDFLYNDNDSCIRIYDNGIGMSSIEILEALRYGSRRDYSNVDLGKFGLGLKTASLSHCRKLTVASKQNGKEIPSILMWDMDHIETEDVWEALKLNVDEANPLLLEKLTGCTGTVVLWQALDRVTTGSADLSTFLSMCRLLEEHLGMVFHRFLEQKAQRKLPLSIFVNGNLVKPWDPFARGEVETRLLPSSELQYEHKGKVLKANIQPYILPPEQLFSSKAAHTAAAGPKRWNRQQGFYIYRNDRLIQSGGWNRLRAADEHTKLARIAVDFSSVADESFKVNIAKMNVQFPVEIRQTLTNIAATVAAAANKVYREASKSPLRRAKTSVTQNSANNSNHIKENIAAPTTSIKDQTNVIQNDDNNNNSTQFEGGRITQATVQTALNLNSTTIIDVSGKGLNEVLTQSSGLTRSSSLVEAVLTVLNKELSNHPELLRRVLISLAKHRPEFRSGGEV